MIKQYLILLNKRILSLLEMRDQGVLNPWCIFSCENSLYMILVSVALNNVLGSVNTSPHISRSYLAFLLMRVYQDVIRRDSKKRILLTHLERDVLKVGWSLYFACLFSWETVLLELTNLLRLILHMRERFLRLICIPVHLRQFLKFELLRMQICNRFLRS